MIMEADPSKCSSSYASSVDITRGLSTKALMETGSTFVRPVIRSELPLTGVEL